VLLSLSLVCSGCFVDAIGEQGGGAPGSSSSTTSGEVTTASTTSTSTSSSTGASGGAGGMGSTSSSGGAGGEGGEGGAGGGACTNHGALFDGVDDRLTLTPMSNILSDSSDFRFQLSVDPSNTMPDGAAFLAGRYAPSGGKGWALFLVKAGTNFQIRADIFQQGVAQPRSVLSGPIPSFPAQLELLYDPDTIYVSADGTVIGSQVCGSSSLASEDMGPFLVGRGPSPTTPFKGKIDDVFYVSDILDQTACVNGNTRDRGWDFETVNGQLVAPVAGCTDVLVLGASPNDTAGDPIIGCFP
jgi:hypothetical protein